MGKETDLGERGHQPRDDEPDEKGQKCPQVERQREAFPAEIIPQRDERIILDSETDRCDQNEEKKSPFQYTHGFPPSAL
jgi:hypothetical protein